ncbi:MAG: C-terminal binding protein [Candidatus Omnitrophica bacterium]|nr:C-terminal binding protein [Candidatus Omnitrophota bacterium]
MKIALCDAGLKNADIEREIYGRFGFELEVRICRTAEDVIAFGREADALCICQHPANARVISELKRCRILARYGAGLDTVDIAAATRAGIVVTNVPHAAVHEVSEHAISLLLACIRRIVNHDRRIRSGEWGIYEKEPVYRIHGKTLGVIGLGAIARKLVAKLRGFELRVLACDPFVKPEVARVLNVELVSLDQLLSESDYVTIHAPLNDQTRHLINAQTIERMKSQAILVNCSRGALVDTAALADALRKRRIAAAGVDVHETEPPPRNYALYELDNVIVSDHAAWYSEDSVAQIQREAAEGVVAVLTGKRPANLVNPEVYEVLAGKQVGSNRTGGPSTSPTML